ncbi:MAG: hypothetical protein BroJett013_30220 [Alphaproteobacteria bacterium]|nr:MAG: hypothetical protein BroJett013_30220 [Alphaproteobacteria bacterium]
MRLARPRLLLRRLLACGRRADGRGAMKLNRFLYWARFWFAALGVMGASYHGARWLIAVLEGRP